jgi:hypothetical protein
MAKLTCSNCGKWIPIHGNVCPYCGADKAEDRRLELLDRPARWLGILGLAIGATLGGIAGLVADYLGGGWAMLFLGIAAGAITGYMLGYRASRT